MLGFLALTGEATPYDLKQRIAISVGQFWSFPHSQLYAEPERLAGAGYLTVEQERGGRRRKRYGLTETGRRAFEEWTEGPPPEEMWELRDPALLKLFFGADPERLAATQLTAARAKLAGYEELRAVDPGSGPRGPWLALDAGIGHMREAVRFWSKQAGKEG